MATLWTQRDSNIRKTWLLVTIFLIVVISIGWVFAQVFGDPAILVIAVVLSILMSVGSYWWSDKIVIASTRARPLPDEEAPDLHNIIENLAITAGIPKPRIYRVDSSQPNAFATGRDPDHAVVAVTSGLLTMMNRTELEGVLAHEMSHIGNRDMLVSTVVVVLVGFLQLLSDIFMRSVFWGRGDRDRNTHPALLIIGMLLAILAPLAGILIQLAVSRKREYLADASGALLTRYPEGLASALEKLARDNTPMAQANHATAHLWLDDPYQGKKTPALWFTKLFMTHPPIEDRIRILRGMRV
ncbi:MAG: zinc metalloprotease HtpX [Candidatus Ryanbacteria bacterium RIFCSPLOWO2_02_FULL_47_14]|uniref:Protease HtpX homolog n=1 Tax=Candidatus Ryanbacteria bacterium RIFCSPLOWO2_02_FULL_47_14 TaxID=1802129 RepID=A0A1G2GZ75_9BACT|nr:MAG: zinc metalloprotease HtpX [Candidatus Ryanbacteria bacterium RIFCSPHIGHO2_02_FULL_47_25]OGZ55525.1 MAG: zinc metalloprotease HtpX [Candidatus Ryanbacteria bacterium RIFCSPLOWO2_02_FULL_47_14]